MKLPVPVFSEVEAGGKRGGAAESMLLCPDCGNITGIYVSTMRRMDAFGANDEGKEFKELVWERWQCISCQNIWIEKYGISAKKKKSFILKRED